MLQVIKQSKEDRFKMYMECCTKEQLANMLIECNRIFESTEKLFVVPYFNPNLITSEPDKQ